MKTSHHQSTLQGLHGQTFLFSKQVRNIIFSSLLNLSMRLQSNLVWKSCCKSNLMNEGTINHDKVMKKIHVFSSEVIQFCWAKSIAQTHNPTHTQKKKKQWPSEDKSDITTERVTQLVCCIQCYPSISSWCHSTCLKTYCICVDQHRSTSNMVKYTPCK